MAGEIEVEVVNSTSGVESLAPLWREWESHPNTLLGHFLLVCKSREGVDSPLVFVASKNGKARAILVGRLERVMIAPRVGYLSPVKIPASALVILRNGLLGEANMDITRAFAAEIERFQRTAGVDLVRFGFLAEDSPLLPALKELYSPRYFDDKLPWSLHWEMKIPSEPGFVLKRMKSKNRYVIKKNERHLEEKYSNRITWTWLKDFDDVGDICERLERVASCSYQRGLGAGFVDNEEYRERFEFFAKVGMLRMQILEIDGNVSAFCIGTLVQGVFHGSDTAYDQSLRDYGVGTLIFLRLFDSLVAEGASRLDFGSGDATYKRRFADRYWRERSYDFFAPTIKGRALDILTLVVKVVDRMGRRFVEFFGILRPIKTAWRRRVAGKK